MGDISRRAMLATTGLGLLGAGVATGLAKNITDGGDQQTTASHKNSGPLALSDYEPRSMLHVKETHVSRARYPAIDFHTHITESAHTVNGVALGAKRVYAATPEELLPVMDRVNLHSMVNLTGGFGEGIRDSVNRYDRNSPDRFYSFTEPSYDLFGRPDYGQLQADAIVQAHRDGARGLKILKTLGLYLREHTTTGPLVKIDDPRFDSMWESCGSLGIPVAIHVSDPIAFFTPTDRFNERYEELSNHPDWSFARPGYPSNAELLEARNRVFARHPKTQFVALHVGNFAENLENVSENLNRFPNMSVDIAARLNELGRQPRAARKFFDRYQDRIVFGTDATPHGDKFPQQVFGDALYQIYFRFLETDDEYFDYAPASVPPQGRWRISGIDLPDNILRKVYQENAARLLQVSV
jgi:predicted TIM-barrel fold metal-dependent hydrolase